MERNESWKGILEMECIRLGDSVDGGHRDEGGVLGNWADGGNNNRPQNTEAGLDKPFISARLLLP